MEITMPTSASTFCMLFAFFLGLFVGRIKSNKRRVALLLTSVPIYILFFLLLYSRIRAPIWRLMIPLPGCLSAVTGYLGFVVGRVLVRFERSSSG